MKRLMALVTVLALGLVTTASAQQANQQANQPAQAQQFQGLTEEQLRQAYDQLGSILQQIEQQRTQQQTAQQQAAQQQTTGQQAFAERIQALERQNLQRTLFEAQQRLRNLAADIQAGRNPEQAAQEIERIVSALNTAGVLAQEVEETNRALVQLELLRQQVMQQQQEAAGTLNQVVERLNQQADGQAQGPQATQADVRQQAQMFAQIPQVQERITQLQQALEQGDQEQAQRIAQELDAQFAQFRQVLATQAATQAQAQGQTQMAAAQNLRDLLQQGVASVPTPELAQALGSLRQSLPQTDAYADVRNGLARVEQALTAQPFDQAALVQALQELALAMRAAADAGDQALTVELASLVDQTADFIQDEGYTPRMEVEAP